MNRHHSFHLAATILCVLLLAGCGSSDGNKQNNVYNIDISDEAAERILISDFSYFKPEATDESFLYNIEDILPFKDGYILLGRETALYFLKDGSYAGKPGDKGRGPGEYLALSSCYVFKDTVHIYSRDSRGIFQYTEDNGEFTYVGKIDTPDTLAVRSLIRTELYPDYYYGANIYHGIGGVTPCVSVFDRQFHRLASSTACVKDGGMSWNFPILLSEDGLFYIEYLTYTLTELKNGTIDESRRFDFGRNSYPDKYVNYTSSTEVHKFLQTQDGWEKSYLAPPVRKQGGCLYIGLSAGRIAKYDLETGKSEVVRFMSNDTDYFPYSIFTLDGDTLLLASSMPDNTDENPPIYRIPIKDIF
ncbi:MAG TPA: 6-bladed beta-propeller [Candidatus Coprenecus merdipullorum]|nr:6-bladed beta-propeller [Candidatus Coprenecus merdipullorum]